VRTAVFDESLSSGPTNGIQTRFTVVAPNRLKYQTRGGPSAIVTTLGVLRFPPEGGEAQLASVHPGHTVEEVRAETGWELLVAPEVGETPAPTEEELRQIRRFDPDGFWTRRG